MARTSESAVNKVFWRTQLNGEKVLQGWCYKMGDKVSKIYETKELAEQALLIRIMGGRGRSTIKTAKRV